MHNNHTYPAVHWTNGMKLSSQHFIQGDAYHINQLRDGLELLLTDFNFGLLAPQEGQRTPLDFDLHIHEDRVELQLRQCNAITRGGIRITFLAEDQAPLTASANSSDYENHDQIRLQVLVKANPFERIPVGQPDPEESPLRHPHTAPTYSLEILPASQVNLRYIGGHYLPIGSILWREKRFEWEDAYIPPCSNSLVYPELRNIHTRFESYLKTLQSESATILRNAQRPSNQDRPEFDRVLAKNTSKLCEEVLRFLAETTFEFNNYSKSGPPILLVQPAAQLAARLHAVLDFIPEAERERLLAYFYQWTEMQPNHFRQSLSQAADLRYDHLNAQEAIGEAENFFMLLAGLWDRLSGLKFIGQNDNNLVMGIESEYKTSRETSHSLLD